MQRKLMVISIILVSILGIAFGLNIGQLFFIFAISLGIYTPILIVKDKLNKFLKLKESSEEIKQTEIVKKEDELKKINKKGYSPTLKNEFLREEFEKEKILIKKKSN